MSASKKIVLYYPVQSDPARGLVTSAHLLPLSLLAIAAWPRRDGYQVVLIDGNLHEVAEAHRRVVEACEGALLYATTGILGFQVADGLACTRAVKETHPELPAFIGGWFANAAPELQLETGLYDALAVGQGELTFRELVRVVDEGRKLEQVAGLALWRDGRVEYTAPRKVVGWNELLDPPWELLDWPAYEARQREPWHRNTVEVMSPLPGRAPDEPFTTISYFSSFGCPLDCAFCCSPETTLRRWKAVPAARMLDDIEGLWRRWNFDAIHFFDANWGVAEKRVREFAQGLIERGIRIHYHAYMQADSVVAYAPETLDLLAESGLYAVIIGAETGSDATMEMIRKTTRGDDNIRAAELLDERGISAYCTYLIGFPGEEPASMLQTLDQSRRMASACPIATPSVWEYQPIPGAALYQAALEEGFVPPGSLEEWGAFYDYRRDTSPGWLTPEVERMRKLYRHFTSVVGGELRGKIGFWERRAAKRLADAEGFARGWPGGLLEARAFHLWQKLERCLPRWMTERGARIERGWKTRRGHADRYEEAPVERREEIVLR